MASASASSFRGSPIGSPPIITVAPDAPAGSGGGPVPIWSRLAGSLWRYRWLVLVCTLAGAALSLLAHKVVPPTYTVSARLWISDPAQRSDSTGPLRRDPLLPAEAWGNLLTSFAVLDRVATTVGLYLTPAREAERAFFGDFAVAETVVPGAYELSVAADGRATLARDGEAVETVAAGDSVGRAVGFRWVPGAIPRGRTVKFAVTTPRDAATTLRERLDVALDGDRFVTLTLAGSNPDLDARVINTLARELTGTATTLQRQGDAELARILERQVSDAARALAEAESELSAFRAGAITQPSAGSLADAQRDPTVEAFFSQRLRLDSVRSERERVQSALAAIQRDGSVERLMTIPSVREAPEMRSLVAQLTRLEDSLQTLRSTFTEEYGPARELQRSAQRLTTEVIPAAARRVVSRLEAREAELSVDLGRSGGALRGIPERAQRELQLAREVEVREGLYTALHRRYESARMSEASAIAPMTLLDSAVVPLRPSSPLRTAIVGAPLAAGLGSGVMLALLLAWRDPRVRYPEQVFELGLPILGAVPRVPPATRRGHADRAALAFEALRGLRVNLRHAQPEPGPLTLCVTSPSEGDGKSFLASSLAVAFAQAGYRTLLIDGDTRRGQLHYTFGLDSSPGLSDFLAGHVTPDQIARRGSHENLLVIPAGAKLENSPELLMSERLQTLLAAIRPMLDVIIVDSPPVGAGADALVLGTMMRNVLLVLRAGRTDRTMAAARLDVLDRLPVRVVGAVLNDVKPEGAFKDYTFLDSYATPVPGGMPMGGEASRA